MIDAVDAAAAADVSIVIVGTNDDWESEGWDRAELELPGRQDELIARVAEVCPRTVVVVNAGSPVAMPWAESVSRRCSWRGSPARRWATRWPTSCSATSSRRAGCRSRSRAGSRTPRRSSIIPGRNGVAAIPRTPPRRLPLVRHRRARAAVRVRPRARLRRRVDHLGAGARSVHRRGRPDQHERPRRRRVVQVYVHRDGHDGAGDEPTQRLVGFAKIDVPADGLRRPR